MIRLFLQNLFINNLILLPYIGLLRVKSLLEPQSYEECIGVSSLLDWIYLTCSPRLLSIVAIFLIFFQALLINQLVNSTKLNSKNSLLAGFVFCLGMCLMPQFSILHPILIGNTFILLMLIELSNLYKSYKPIKALFMSGFYTGISFLLVPHFIILIFFIFQALLIMRDLDLREFLQSAAGLLVPIFLATVFTLDRDLSLLHFSEISFQIPKLNEIGTASYNILGLLFWVFVTIYIIWNQNNLRKKKSIKAQKMLTLLFVLMAYTLPMIFFNSANTLIHLSTFVISCSILYAMLLFVTKRLILAEFLHLVIVVVLLLHQFDKLI